MKLYIFRHGQTEANAQDIVQGIGVDSHLSAIGREQAEGLKDKLSICDIKVFYSSYLSRAQETAKIVASSNNAEVITLDGLEEIHLGDAEGMLSAEAHQKFAQIFEIVNDDNHPLQLDTAIPNGETIRQSTNRALKALDYIKHNCPYDRVGVATHGGIMFNLYRNLYGEKHKFDNCECFELDL